jgi:hypothetical protein
MSTPWIPRALVSAPRLEPGVEPGPFRAKFALLINPFYPKDPHASFRKHVLTPSLALTSIAGATPPDWEVAYWDENHFSTQVSFAKSSAALQCLWRAAGESSPQQATFRRPEITLTRRASEGCRGPIAESARSRRWRVGLV